MNSRKRWQPLTCEDCGKRTATLKRRIPGTPFGDCYDCGGTIRHGTPNQLIARSEARKRTKTRRLGSSPLGGSWGTRPQHTA